MAPIQRDPDKYAQQAGHACVSDVSPYGPCARVLRAAKREVRIAEVETNVTAPGPVQYELGQVADMLHGRSGGLAAASLVATGVTCVELFAVSPLFINPIEGGLI